MTEFTVIAYEKENGEVPVEDFLNSLDVKMRAKMFGMIGLLQEKAISSENHIASILMMEYSNLDVRLEAISQESFISFIMKGRLFLLMDL